jgi:hypothetical protein
MYDDRSFRHGLGLGLIVAFILWATLWGPGLEACTR